MGLIAREVSEYITRFPYAGGSRDSQGNAIKAWGDGNRPEDQLGIYVFDPGGSSEPQRPGHDRVITEPTIYLPPGSPFGPHDQCEVRGKRYQVQGEPAQWVHPRRGPQGDVVKLRRVDG